MLIPEVDFSGIARALGAESAVIRSLEDRRLGAGALADPSWILGTLPAELLVGHRFVLKEESRLGGLFPRSYPK